ncbi:hypothetical protein ACIRG4_35015 [Streptomyces sp. NPDC102395]|uniref:hypothetical protein n=1 Tax=Streptomyces sp. NPDC102395 TaxID=3366168 RepID=UPI0038258563
MTSAASAELSGPDQAEGSERVPDDAPVLPDHVLAAAGRPGPGPRFADPVWDLGPFLPRSTSQRTIVFTSVADPITALVLREYLYSRLRRGNSALVRRGPMKLTGIFGAAQKARTVIATLQAVGARRLSEVTTQHLQAALERWQAVSAEEAALRVTAVKHLFAHGPFLTADRLLVNPWPGRSAHAVAGVVRDEENTTERIPEATIAPLVKGAVFYVTTAGPDILAARAEYAELAVAHTTQRRPRGSGSARARIEEYVAELRATGRGVPALPTRQAARGVGVPTVDGVPQAPNAALVARLTGVSASVEVRRYLTEAATELGYEIGGLRTALSNWPSSGRPWRPGLGPLELATEVVQLRMACWIVIAYLSGMRDAEVRELAPDCAFTENGPDGRIRYKLRGRVLKGRKLAGEEAEWVVLDIVHQAVALLTAVNDDPTHLFGHKGMTSNSLVLFGSVNRRLNDFRDHLNALFSTSDIPYVPLHMAAPEPGTEPTAHDEPGREEKEDPEEEPVPWRLSTRQFRRTLAWHIAHQPFGVVAGARQYQHAELALFEGYAGTSASGFAAEVAAERAVAQLDYVEDLYRDWNDGHRASGGAAGRVNAEFDRIRRELGDLPGITASPARLRTMLQHLTKTLHPGVLNDCFYQHSTAVCAKRAHHTGRPLPLLTMCLTCPNARRSSVHLPRLTTARAQAQRPLDAPAGLSRLQAAALTTHIAELDHAIAELRTDTGGPST